MIIFMAPVPDYLIRIVMPNPEWGDMQRGISTVQVKQALDGSVVTHVHRIPNARLFELKFQLTRLKSIEFLEFYQRFGGDKMQMELYSEVKVGYLKINPLELEKTKRALVALSLEQIDVSLSFETVT